MSLKNIILKSIASTIAVSILFGNIAICGVGIGEVIAENQIAPEIKMELNNKKYVQYQDENNAGVAIQSVLSIYPNQTRDNYLPIKNAEVDLNLPSLNGYFPESATVVEARIKTTTGEEKSTKFTQDYHADSGLLVLSYENTPKKEGETDDELKENVKDEFEIIYHYPAEAYTGNDVAIKLAYAISGKMNFQTKTGEVTSIGSEKIELTEKENKEDITTFQIADLKEDIYKGFLYSNVENKTDYDTEYNTIAILTVLNHQLVNELMMEVKESQFVLNDKIETKIDGKIVYPTTRINKDEFDRMLGQEGMIEFYQGEEVLATVKYVEVEKDRKLAVVYLDETIKVLEDDETMLMVEHPENTTNLKIKTSKPIAEGFIHFENKNVIKADKDYGCEIDRIKAITTGCVVNEHESDTQILLLEPQTKVTVTSSNQNFSTLQKSKTTLTIGLDDTNARAKLFDNPVITIKLPEGLIGGNLSSPEIVNGNGLTIKKATAKNNVITIELAGKQTEYDLKSVSGGTSIVMDIENISFKDTLPTHTDKIEVTCTQEKETKVATLDVNIISKAGLLMLSKLSNYDETNEIVSTIDSNMKTVQIQENAEAREVINTLDLVNNYDEPLTNVQIVGRLGNSNSTFDTLLTKPIEVSTKNAKVYYSKNKDAKVDDSSWSENFTADAKMYKVIFNNNQLSKMETVEIKTYVQIPKNLEVNQKTYLNASVAYTYQGNNMQNEATIEIKTATNRLLNNMTTLKKEVTTQTGENIPIELSIVPVITENYIHSGQIVTYQIKVKNNGQTDLHNLVLKDIIPENAIYTYYEEKGERSEKYLELVKKEDIKLREWDIDTIKVDQTKEFEIMLTMADVEADQEIINKIELNCNEQTINAQSSLKLKKANIQTSLTTREEEWVSVTYEPFHTIEYYIKVKNVTNQNINNAKVQYAIPEYLEYTEGGLGVYDQFEGYSIGNTGTFNNHIFEYNIEKLKANEEQTIVVRCKVKRLQETYNATVVSIANVMVENEIYQTNIKKVAVESSILFNISMETDVKEGQTLKNGDKVTYTIKAKNIGKKEAGFILKDNLPEEIELESVEYGIEGKDTIKKESFTNHISINGYAKPEETYIVKITGYVWVESDEDTVDINNKAELMIGDYQLTSHDKTIKVMIEHKTEDKEPDTSEQLDNPEQPSSPEQPDNPEQPNTPEEKTYTITGVAWVDENKNAQRDENEKLQDSVVVSLVNKETGNFALDEQGNKITTTTDTNGKYTFSNISEGIYIILFEFDTNTYTVATYQKEGIEEQFNSDAILSTVTMDGQRKVVAITDAIEINNNKEHIDIGLMENAIFDLSLNKQITKITVSNSKGTEVTEYEDGETAKIDLVAKYMNTAKVIVNYQFTVKNEGDVTGYVNSLVDNLPSGLEFSSDLNKDWYKGNDGKLYTTALEGKAIKPGESAQIELILTKTMTEENTGTFPNSASLDKISNLENISEKTEAMENNQSSALLIISIKTGSVALYMGITLLSIGILAVGAYFIKKKVLNKGI